MAQELTTLSPNAEVDGQKLWVLRFVVKKIKGNIYVYLQGREEDGKVRTIYIGPLDKIVKTYLSVSNGNENLRKVAPGRGLEPPTTGLTARRSTG